jgi:hypothetical protein
VSDYLAGKIGKYTTSGTTVDASLVTGLSHPIGLVAVPEPSCWGLVGLGAAALVVLRRRQIARRH